MYKVNTYVYNLTGSFFGSNSMNGKVTKHVVADKNGRVVAIFPVHLYDAQDVLHTADEHEQLKHANALCEYMNKFYKNKMEFNLTM